MPLKTAAVDHGDRTTEVVVAVQIAVQHDGYETPRTTRRNQKRLAGINLHYIRAT